MNMRVLSGRMVSVVDAIGNQRFHDNQVAVHGLFYKGRESIEGEFLCLPKQGPFNGIDPGLVNIKDRNDVLMIKEPRLGDALKKVPMACGDYIYKYDSIIVGTIRKEKCLAYSTLLTDLWFMILQVTNPMPNGNDFCEFHIVEFSDGDFPKQSWTGLIERTNIPLLDYRVL